MTLADIQQALIDNGKKIYELPDYVLDLGDPWTLTGDWMIVGDVHSPTVNWGFSSLVTQVAMKHMEEPRRLIIAGDLFNADAFSSFAPTVQHPTWAQERDATRALLQEWLTVFSEIRLIMGNHERRIQRFTLGAFDTADILALLISNPDRAKLSGYSYCMINTPGGTWRVTHPLRYRQNPLSVANSLAITKQMNIISFHEHHIGISMDSSGKYVIANGGTLADHTKIPYMVLADDTKPQNKTGFTMLKNGAAYIFGDAPLTDWSFWL